MGYSGRYARDKHPQEADETRSAVGQFIDDHIRLIVAVLTIVLLLTVGIVADFTMNGNPFGEKDGEADGELLTLGYVYGLSKKNGPISWADFDGYACDTLGDSEDENGVYELRRYMIKGEKLSVTVAGFIDGKGYTGYVEYATVTYIDDFDFEFSLLEDGDLLAYLEKFGVKPE